MKRCRRSPLRLSLFLGPAVLFLSGCSHNVINQTLAQNGKIVLHPEFGDQISWDPGLNGLKVIFLVSPCEEGTAPTNTCHVNVKLQQGEFGQYNYICKGGNGIICRDPEVDVGSSTQVPPLTASGTKSSDPDPDFVVALPCLSNTIKPSLPDVSQDAYGQPVTPGKVVQWTSNGGPTVYLNDWTVAFIDSGNTDITTTVCDAGGIHDAQGSKSCSLKQGLPPATYHYTAASMHCGSGSGTVVVTMN